jgi:hypothetical protein
MVFFKVLMRLFVGGRRRRSMSNNGNLRAVQSKRICRRLHCCDRRPSIQSSPHVWQSLNGYKGFGGKEDWFISSSALMTLQDELVTCLAAWAVQCKNGPNKNGDFLPT